MKQLRAWIVRLAGVFSKRRREQEIADEIESHLQMQMDDNLRAGMTRDEARRQAIVKLGGVEQTKQIYRERGTMPLVEGLLQDLRFALRQLVKNPAFAVTTIFVVALGMGACVAIFTFVDVTLIKPLPYWRPDRLVEVTESVPMIPRADLSYPDYLDWKSRNDVLSSLDVWTRQGSMLNTPSGVQLIMAGRVSDGFFATLGVAPLLGRDFYKGEDLASAPLTVILSYAGWQKWFGGRPDVIGQPVTLNGDAYTVVGVMPQSFQFAVGGNPAFWITLHPKSHCDLRRGCHDLRGVGRLKDGVAVQKVDAEMKAIAAQLERQYPDSNRGQSAIAEPLRDVMIGDIRPMLLVLLAGAGLLLLIGCVNSSSLLLVRAESRRHEIAVRGALGASQTRLLRQFVTEGLVLVIAGAALGMGFAALLVRVLLGFLTQELIVYTPFVNGLGIDWRAIAFAGGLSLFCLMIFSLAPTLRFTRAGDLRDVLARDHRTGSGTSWRRFASNLVVVELALAVVLLASAGLLTKSLYRLLHVDIGFQSDNLATMQVAMPPTYSTDAKQVALGRQILRSIVALPGVTSAGLTTRTPVSSNGNTTWIRFVGRPYHGEHYEVNQRNVSSEFLKTLEARLVRGRYFSDAEDASKPGVVIINEALAKKYFPNEDPIGKMIGDTDLSPKSVQEIIGVVADIREGTLADEIWPAVYEPFNQGPDDYVTVLARSNQAPESLLPAMAAALRQVDPGIAIYDQASMNQRIYDSPPAYMHRTAAWLIGGFAGLALVLGAVGLYGVIAYSVSQRTREIGVRVALGAQRRAVYQLIMGEAGWLTGLGILAGMICAIIAGFLMRALLFGVPAWDVPTLLTVAVLLSLAALMAAYLPARSAASVNPVDALRAE